MPPALPRARRGYLSVSALLLFALLPFLPAPADAQPSRIPAAPALDQQQLPILYHHGFNDDGRLWALNAEGTGSGTAAEYWATLEVRAPNGALLHNGLETYVIQYWATSNDPNVPDGNPDATAAEGWAALKTPAQIRTPGQNYNSPDPVGYLLDNADQLLQIVPECTLTITGVQCTFPATEVLKGARDRFITSNYNRNGVVEHHSQDLAELLEGLFATDSRFAGLRQVNVITHSAGGVDVRATLHRLNQSDAQDVRETIANVIYTAPPFGGSTAAVFAGLFYEETIDASVFQDPWLLNGAGALTLRELFLALARSFVDPRAEQVMTLLFDAVPKPLGLDPSAVTIEQLATNPALATLAVPFVYALRDLVTGFLGFPGTPKVLTDLTPRGAVENLNRYQPNFNTSQFVTWAEGGGAINLSPSLSAAQAAYDASGTCCEAFLDPEGLTRPPDDWALSNVSARMLATEAGGMQELAGYPTLWHGNITTELEIVGLDWARTLVTPVTDLLVSGPIFAESAEDRYYLAGPTTTLQFVPEAREVRDRFGQTATIAAQAVEYRVVTYSADQEPTYHPWVTVPPNASVQLADLEQGAIDLSGEQLFRLDWRAVSQSGAREAIRSASFRMDTTAPSVVLIDVFTPGIEDNPEIVGAATRTVGRRFRRGSLLTGRTDLTNLARLTGQPESNWIISNPSNKLLRIDFDEPGARVRYQWDDFFTDPTTTTLPDVSLALPLSDLTPGPHTLYFEVSDALGNVTNAVQSIRILVDDQPPVVGLNYTPAGALGIVVGPETPLEFVAEDVETGVVTGGLTVPGLGTIGVNQSVRLGETSIADAAEGTGILGTFVSLQADVRDAVNNRQTQRFDVYYDFSPPRLDLQHVGESVLTTEGIYRTTEHAVRVEVLVRDNAGFEPPTWTASKPGTDQLRGGLPFRLESAGGRREAYGGTVPLFDGLNVIVVTARDLVGNTASLSLTIEKVETLIEDDPDRPIELLSRRIEGGLIGRNGPANVAMSDDGSVFAFDSSRRDHVADDTNDQRDIFVWRNSTVLRANTSADGTPAADGESRSPAVSGDGRYVFFASEATNLVDTPTSGWNLYVKDLRTGRIALISRRLDGTPANLSDGFARLSWLRMSATYSGRYLFFADRFDGYVADDTNGNLDVFVADLDPDVNGDFFDTAPVITRVSRGFDGSEATGGGLTGGSRYPSASRDGLFVTFQTSHTNLVPGDTNDRTDAVLVRFGGVDAEGTIDLSSITAIPLATAADGTTAEWGSEHPTIDRTGRTVAFITAQNLLLEDTNNEGVDTDVYLSTGFLENWQNRVLTLASTSTSGAAVSGRLAPNHAPTVADYTAEGTPRVAYLADKSTLVEGDNNDALDLFVHTGGAGTAPEAINWLGATVPSTLSVREGGITPDGAYAWWVTLEEYSTVVGAGTGLDLYRRRLDPEAAMEAPQIVQQPADVAAFAGENVALSVQATGRPAPAYQWFRNGEPLFGATNATLFLSNIGFADAGRYTVRVSNEAGEVTSAPATLTITSLTPVFLTQPVPVEVRVGEEAVLTAETAGLAPLARQWLRNGVPLADDGRIQGATTDTLRIAPAQVADGGTYALQLSNPRGTLTSEAVLLTVTPSTATTDEATLPTTFTLDQNYPNPFNPITSIRYGLPEPAHVRLELYTLLGQRVAVLADTDQAAGWHTVTVDGRHLASGAYLYVLHAGDHTSSRTLVLLK
ncbi:hypothetical protein AWN76_002265 [Rhodothermaceae bacterium RA]|nr:hypothetical protein AWN76_002265 [Rhodothermaceae bacterium RA]